MRRLLVLLAVAAGTLVAPADSASAGVVPGACTTSKGVTVVVNFGTLGGGTRVSCYSGAGSLTDGVDALKGAGFDPTGTNNYGLAFICRINGAPGNPPEDCQDTPPETAYWSYWYASNGGAWTYSSKGAQGRHVILGGFEGWSFGNGHTKPTSGNPSRPPEPTFTLGGAASTTTHRSSTSSRTTAKPTPTTSTSSPTATATATSTSGDSATALAAGPSGTAGAELAGDGPDPGRSPWPFVVGALAVAAILGGAYLVVVRRRGSGY